ncbi:Antilisterial bacteriocin subtilosin biosynthesis protein AlbA [Aquisphaera giovannonii]|uniref:Antilisterial bacteriocin subtilosin biosynthesis protein AlbA n=1 Tax=Aquisphaera giovannonii TaxID=406548 RepID=A0A5B9W0A2_9BACT|nr:TIGR04053 family radical SAM/SPASM domain-containing protein [Aquisphaera giovannonii]QEH33330.1 Antilisterial bacteriocin subtilosin biosynthesis protein AlbA [Aquisphaera giovannonii]
MDVPNAAVLHGRGMGRFAERDFAKSPLIVFYEVTKACDLVCRHCRASAQPQSDPNELSTELAKRLIDQLASFSVQPMLVLSGGDPLKRPDIYELVRHSAESGLETAITPSPTPLVTTGAIARLKEAGVHRMAVSIDGADAATHDGLRGVAGSFDQTQRIMRDARALNIPVQVNTTLNPANYGQIEAMADMLAGHGIVLWSLFLIVPVGRATADLRMTGEQYERAFARIYAQSLKQPYGIKTTEGMHYRRYVAQRRVRAKQEAARAGAPSPAGGMPAGPPRGRDGRPGHPQFLTTGVNDGKGVMFISHAGLIHPSGFMPLVCGMFPFNSVVDVYQNAPIFRRLREPDTFEGKCGYCEFRNLCGGSRARAFNVAGSPYAAEPDCVYQPAGVPAAV